MAAALSDWEQQILDRIRVLPHGRANARTLMREMRIRGEDRRPFDRALDRLIERGELIELRGGQFVLPGMTREYAVGRLNMHRDGYGFVIPDVPPPGMSGDIFIPPKSSFASTSAAAS